MNDVFRARLALLALMGVLLFGLHAEADVVSAVSQDYGGNLSNEPDYAWWYGCSPTSAGMMMGYYDRNGYGGLLYSNLVPGGVAESSTFGVAAWSTQAQSTIASSRHVSDFYVSGYNASGDDVPGAPTGPLNSLADFMGTSQDVYGNPNGATSFWNWTNGSRMTSSDIYGLGASYYNDSGMYGMLEYAQYAGYDVTQLYNQYADSLGLTYGFTYDDYKAEIDAGRPVMVHVYTEGVGGHSMMGYGYDESGGNYVVLNDTWSAGPNTMLWGGSYGGMALSDVTVMELTGGALVPEPTMVVGLVSMIPVGLGFWWRRRRK